MRGPIGSIFIVIGDHHDQLGAGCLEASIPLGDLLNHVHETGVADGEIFFAIELINLPLAGDLLFAIGRPFFWAGLSDPLTAIQMLGQHLLAAVLEHEAGGALGVATAVSGDRVAGLAGPASAEDAAPAVAGVLVVNPAILLVLAGRVAGVVEAKDEGVVENAVGVMLPTAYRAVVVLPRAGERLCIGDSLD